jgi:fermentation-respiration switch protein FrsA (DUF1100 family)
MPAPWTRFFVMLLWLLAACILLYACYAAYFYALQRTLLFPRHLIVPRAAPTLPGLEQGWLATSQGQVEHWYLPPVGGAAEKAPLFIIAHGNAELIDDWPEAVSALRRMGAGVLLVEYPGYGRSQGAPSQAAIGEALVAGYDAILDHPRVDQERIVLFGRSVGGGAVATLAAQRPSAALILFSTFTSVRALAAGYGLPGLAVRDPFDTLAVVSAYRGPVLILHGRRDRTIPYSHGLALHQAAQEGELRTLACDHNDCVVDWERFWQELRPFLRRAGIVR